MFEQGTSYPLARQDGCIRNVFPTVLRYHLGKKQQKVDFMGRYNNIVSID